MEETFNHEKFSHPMSVINNATSIDASSALFANQNVDFVSNKIWW
jgi:hypothetical protein